MGRCSCLKLPFFVLEEIFQYIISVLRSTASNCNFFTRIVRSFGKCIFQPTDIYSLFYWNGLPTQLVFLICWESIDSQTVFMCHQCSIPPRHYAIPYQRSDNLLLSISLCESGCLFSIFSLHYCGLSLFICFFFNWIWLSQTSLYIWLLYWLTFFFICTRLSSLAVFACLNMFFFNGQHLVY